MKPPSSSHHSDLTTIDIAMLIGLDFFYEWVYKYALLLKTNHTVHNLIIIHLIIYSEQIFKSLNFFYKIISTYYSVFFYVGTYYSSISIFHMNVLHREVFVEFCDHFLQIIFLSRIAEFKTCIHIFSGCHDFPNF